MMVKINTRLVKIITRLCNIFSIIILLKIIFSSLMRCIAIELIMGGQLYNISNFPNPLPCVWVYYVQGFINVLENIIYIIIRMFIYMQMHLKNMNEYILNIAAIFLLDATSRQAWFR